MSPTVVHLVLAEDTYGGKHTTLPRFAAAPGYFVFFLTLYLSVSLSDSLTLRFRTPFLRILGLFLQSALLLTPISGKPALLDVQVLQ